VDVEGEGIDVGMVAREAVDVYLELSKPLHNFPSYISENGILIGGPLPQRAAVLLLILALQNVTENSTLNFDLKYCDSNYKPRWKLEGGKCVPLPTECDM
jgi:hypothetical protein